MIIGVGGGGAGKAISPVIAGVEGWLFSSSDGGVVQLAQVTVAALASPAARSTSVFMGFWVLVRTGLLGFGWVKSDGSGRDSAVRLRYNS